MNLFYRFHQKTTQSEVVSTSNINQSVEMSKNSSKDSQTCLIVGASRGLGFAMVQEFIKLGWQVSATERLGSKSKLHALSTKAEGALKIHTVDISDAHQIKSLRAAMDGVKLDLLFINAGVANGAADDLSTVTDQEFSRIMLTNALGPMRVISEFAAQVDPQGTIGVMSSGLGSVAENTSGGWEVYRGSKAALNTFLKSIAVKNPADKKTYVAMCPGWVRTDMGGANASLSIEQSIPRVVDVLTKAAGKGGVHYLQYDGRQIAW